MVPPRLEIIERVTPLTQALKREQPEAIRVLTVALQQGIAEYVAMDRNEMWNVTARFWLTSCGFGASDREGRPELGQDCYTSNLVLAGDGSGILSMVRSGHACVVVLVSLVPYIRSGHELSVHALASALLEEAERVINLGFLVNANIYTLLSANHKSLPKGEDGCA